MEINYDKNGVPILSREQLDKKAILFLSNFDANCLIIPQATPLASICQFLSDERDLQFYFDYDLGNTKEGYKVYGRFHVKKNAIYIDQSINWDDPRFSFVLAHEIAHYILHRKIKLKVIQNESEHEISDTKRHFIINTLNKNNPRDWIEWQANKYASSLLMPTNTVPIAVKKIQNAIGTRRVGLIYLDHQSGNIKDFDEIQTALAALYETSKISIKIRLSELKLLLEINKGKEHNSSEITHIKNSIGHLFDDMIDKYKKHG